MKVHLPSSEHPRVVIIGGGFGGITLAQGLKKAPYQVVLLDRNNYHTFQPLLYQVATGGLEPDSIAFPLRKMFADQDNLTFRVAQVEEVDPNRKVVQTNIGEVDYDYLVLATGTGTNFFGMDEIAHYAHGMKSIPESLDLRSLILQNFEEVHQEPVQALKEQLMKFVVVGGGPTGVETAGALAELQRHVLPSDYPELDLAQMEVHLIEAGDQLLAGMSEKSARDAKQALEKMGVNVWLNTQVTQYNGVTVETNQDLVLDSRTVIWAAGVKGNLIPGFADEQVGRGARLLVDAYNRVHGLDGVFAVGDIALMISEEFPRGHPQVAPAAMQQGTALAENFQRLQKGAPLLPFEYFDKGSMATIGRNRAVVDFRKLHLRGRIAWLGWMFVHLLYLIGFRNKMVVFVNWVWSYFTYDKGTRLIIRPFKRRPLPEARSVPESV